MLGKTWQQVQKAQWREIEVNWLQSHPQSGSREWTGSGAGLWSLKAHHQWPTSSSQVPHPKGSNLLTQLLAGDPLFKNRSLMRTVQFIFKSTRLCHLHPSPEQHTYKKKNKQTKTLRGYSQELNSCPDCSKCYRYHLIAEPPARLTHTSQIHAVCGCDFAYIEHLKVFIAILEKLA